MIGLDEVDKGILTILGRYGRPTGSQISKDLDTFGVSLTDRGVQQRVARLEEKKIIQEYTTILNSDIIGEKTTKVLLFKFSPSAKLTKIEELNDYLARSSFCLTAARLGGGDFDYICHLVFDTERQFDLQLSIIYRVFGDFIDSHLVNESTIVKQVPYAVSFDPFLEARRRMRPSTKLGLEQTKGSFKDVREELQQFLNDFIRCLGASYVCLWLIDKNTHELLPVLYSEIPKHSDAYSFQYEKLSKYKIDIQLTLQEMTPVLSNDIARDFRITGVNWIIGRGLKSYGGYPLIYENRKSGVLEMYSDRDFSPAEFEMADKLCSELASELVNIDFYWESGLSSFSNDDKV